MTNLEKYRDQIMDILVGNDSHIGVKNGKPVNCDSISCDECDLQDNRYDNCSTCKQATIEWYLEEYKDKIAHWEYEGYPRVIKCSLCGRCEVLPKNDMSNEEIVEMFPYCHCGAKMS